MKPRITVLLICFYFGFASCKNTPSTAPSKALQKSVYSFQQASADGIGKYYMGREIAHVMSASGAEWLERNERQREENTTLAIETMALKEGWTVADIGAGTGYYTFKIAEKIPTGKVFAVEIQDEMIQYLKGNAKKSGINNVTVVKGNNQSANLPTNSIDLVLMVDVYHELEYPHEMLQSINNALKSNGKLLLLEYKAEDPEVPIKPLHKMSVKQVNKELGANGFRLSRNEQVLPMQHFLEYQKTNATNSN
jgi:ubiquinone/menaquinone biosynthesis C-methylase UbiE